MVTSATIWLTRVHGPDGRPRVLRCTSETCPGPDAGWQVIADPFERARYDGGDVTQWARDAEPLGADAMPADGDANADLAPVAPQKIIAIGRNFRAHAAELGNEVPSSPLSFFKPPSALLASGQALALPRGYERIDMEAELVVVIGRRARAVVAQRAWEHVAGYLLGNDVSCRDLQRSDKQWTRAKGFDGFAPVARCLRLAEPGWTLPVEDLELHGWLDEERVQVGSLAAMIFTIPVLIEHLSACMTLEPGDLIFTGTPAGVRPLAPGQVARVELTGLELAPLRTPIC